MKKEPMEEADLDREAWLGPMLRQSPLVTSEGCFDAEILAAWADGALDARKSSLVERHASNCSRCMAMLASVERTRPEVEAPPKRAWAIGPLLRWGVPLTAAATAIAVWVMVPNRSLTRLEPAGARQDTSTSATAPAPAMPAPEPAPNREQDQFAPKLESPAAPQGLDAAIPPPATTAPITADKQVAERSAQGALARENAEPRDEEKRREQSALDALSARARTLQDQNQAPAPPAARPAPPPAAPAPAAAKETFATTPDQQPALVQGIPSSESTAPTNALIRWRVMAWVSVERSIDGGNTWIKTAVPPGVAPTYMPALTLVAIRAVDSLRAVVQTSDGTVLYTTNGGVSWERVQGNSTAPF